MQGYHYFCGLQMCVFHCYHCNTFFFFFSLHFTVFGADIQRDNAIYCPSYDLVYLHWSCLIRFCPFSLTTPLQKKIFHPFLSLLPFQLLPSKANTQKAIFSLQFIEYWVPLQGCRCLMSRSSKHMQHAQQLETLPQLPAKFFIVLPVHIYIQSGFSSL